MRLVAVSIISRPTASVCAIQSSTPKACALPPALSRLDAKWPLARASNAPVCTGPSKAPTPSLLSAVQNSVVVFKTSGSADQNTGPHDPSLSWRAPAFLLNDSFASLRIDDLNSGLAYRAQPSYLLSNFDMRVCPFFVTVQANALFRMASALRGTAFSRAAIIFARWNT